MLMSALCAHAEVAQLVSVTPNPEAGNVTLDTEFVFTFSEAVTYSNLASGIDMQDFFIMPCIITQSEDQKVVTMKFDKDQIAEDYLATEMIELGKYSYGSVSVYLCDVQDAATEAYVEGNNGAGNFYYIYSVDYVPAVFAIEPGEGNVASLKDFTVTYSNDLIWPNSDCEEAITLTCGGQLVASFAYSDLEKGMVLDAKDEDCIAVNFGLDEEVYEPGLYEMHIPAAMFYLGQNWEDCPETTFTWNVAGDIDAIQTIRTAGASISYNLQGQRADADAKGIVVRDGVKMIER